MVCDRVTHTWKQLRNRFKRPGNALLLGSSCLALGIGVLAWLGNDQSGSLKARSTPSLLDLLDEVGHDATQERQSVDPSNPPQPPGQSRGLPLWPDNVLALIPKSKIVFKHNNARLKTGEYR